MLVNKLEIFENGAIELGWEFTYTNDSTPIKLCILCPGALDMVGSLFDYILPAIWVGSSKLRDVPFQHADALIYQRDFLDRYALCLKL